MTTTDSPNKSNSTGHTNKSAMDMFNDSIGGGHYEENRRDGEKKQLSLKNFIIIGNMQHNSTQVISQMQHQQ